MSDEYRDEIVAKLANDVTKVLEHMATEMHDKFQGQKPPSYQDFNEAVGEATNVAIKKLLDNTKDEIHKHGITIEELMTAVRKKNPDLVAKEQFENEDGTSGGDRALGNTYVQERCLKITNKDFKFERRDKKPIKGNSPLNTVFSDDEVTLAWVSALRDDTVLPSFIEMSENYEMTPDAQLTSINYVEEPEHALCNVLTIFEPNRDKENSKIEKLIREPIESSKSAIEIQALKALKLVSVITYVNGFCVEMRYFRILSGGKVSRVPCFVADNKEDNDEWLAKRIIKAKEEAKSTFLDEITEGIKEGKYPVIHADDFEEIAKIIREKAEKRANENLKPKEGHTNNRIKFYDN